MRRLLAILAAMALAASLLAVPAAAAEDEEELVPHAMTEEELVALIEPEIPFTDVPADSWYYQYVVYAYANELFKGTTETTFSPDRNMTRAMFVTVLHRQATALGQDMEVKSEPQFTDISYSNAEFQTAIKWAAANEIVGGKSPTTFAPNEAVNRQQVCAIIVRYLRDYLNCDLSAYNTLAAYADSASVSSYAVDAVNIASNMGLMTGVLVDGENRFQPGEPASRAVVAMAITEAVRQLPALTAGNNFNADLTEEETQEAQEAADAGNAGVSTSVETEEYVPVESAAPVQDEPEEAGAVPVPEESDIPKAELTDMVTRQEAVIATLSETVAYYKQHAPANKSVKDILDVVMGALEKAVADFGTGVAINEDYLNTHFAQEMLSVGTMTGSLSVLDQAAMLTYLTGLPMFDDLMDALDYFGFSL